LPGRIEAPPPLNPYTLNPFPFWPPKHTEEAPNNHSKINNSTNFFLADFADVRRKKSALIRVICAQNEAAP
jgi:hypothetical protein